MEFYHEFGPGFEYYVSRNLPEMFFGLGRGVAALVLAAVLFVALLLVAIGVVTYVMQSLSLYTMAKNRGIDYAWLAWVPIGNSWILGALADDINARQGKKTCYGLVLLIVTAASMAGSFSMFLMPFLGLLSVPVSLAVMVAYYIALYEVYRDYAPKNAVLYLVLSILFSLAWLLLFLLRGRRPVTLGGAAQPTPQPAPRPAQPVCAPTVQPQEQPPVGWYPDPAQQRQAPPQPKECPPEHWGGIMTAEQPVAHQQEYDSPENTNNGMTIKGDKNDEQDPA